jgi:leucyl/phenylalanyl-tRNA---protein transferase
MKIPPQAPLAEILLMAYRRGLFPMADDAVDDDFYFVDPEQRGQLDILGLHIPARLKRTVLQFPYTITVDRAFADIIELCAQAHRTRPKTWINAAIRDAFIELHARGHAHSVEVWRGNQLAGGLYGLAFGSVFCGESMVSRDTDASKIALIHLCARLHRAGFTVLDTQFVNDHLKQFGVYEISRAQYHDRLAPALLEDCDFRLTGDPIANNEPALIKQYFSARVIK